MFIDITKNYGDITVFKNLQLHIEEGKVYCILGPSGCGKTTILRILAGLESYDGGKVDLKDRSISYIFQEPRLLPWETVRKNLELVCENEDLKKIDEYLRAMELEAYALAYPKTLSGGMKQRVSMIRAFLYPHDILLMDEPFQALDIKLKEKLLREAYCFHKKKKNTMITVTHDIEEALFLGDEVIVLSQKPAKIISQLTIDIPREKRNSNHEEMLNLKHHISSLL